MKIGIDARLYGLKHAGIGRYIQNLVDQLAQIDTTTHYHLFVVDPKEIDPLPSNFTLIKTPIRHYTVQEQLEFPKIISQFDLDLVHFPHFNIPIIYNKPFVTTIHDLLWHEKIGLNATTLPAIKYLIKYFGYRITIKNAIKRAQKVITPTNHVANQIKQKFHLNQNHLATTYEAASQIYHNPTKSKQLPSKYNLTKPFFIYTGSLYPHKNVDNLIKAFSSLKDTQLAIVSSRNIFQKQTKRLVEKLKLTSKIRFLGFVSDKDLVNIYTHAQALIQPSQSEGFGLTGLEAMASGLPVIASKHSVMSEVYQQAALYTDTSNPQNITKTIKKIINSRETRTKLVKLGKLQAQKFSWKKMAEETLAIYQEVISNSKK